MKKRETSNDFIRIMPMNLWLLKKRDGFKGTPLKEFAELVKKGEGISICMVLKGHFLGVLSFKGPLSRNFWSW